MKLNATHIEKLISMIGLTREREINCNECLEHVAEYAECELLGKAVPNALESVQHHLDLCPECREEYEILCEALRDMSGESRDA